MDSSTEGSRTPTTVLYAASHGLHRSTNSGNSWTTVLPGFITDLEIDPLQDNVYWAARALGGTANGLWRSAEP